MSMAPFCSPSQQKEQSELRRVYLRFYEVEHNDAPNEQTFMEVSFSKRVDLYLL